jgi:hypothetical protein
MKRLKIFLLILAVPVFFITSCKKDQTASDSGAYKAPSAAGRTTVVDIPAGLTAKANSDVNAALAVTYMGMVNAISSLSSVFTLPANAQLQSKKSTPKVYFWSYQGLSYWMTYTELTDKYTWKYELEYLPTIPRYTFISADELKTGKQGSWTIYSQLTTSSVAWTYNWSINASNAYIANMTWNEGSAGTSTFNVTVNADKSGTFVYNIGVDKQAEITWTSTGSGTYWLKGYGASPITGSWT